MRIHPLAAALLAACAWAPLAHAQDEAPVLRPGSGEVAAGAIRESVDRLDLYLGARELAGRMTLHTSFATIGGVDAIVRTEKTWVEDDLVLTDSFVVDRRTLAPLYYSSAGEQVTALEFLPGQVRTLIDEGLEGPVTDIAQPVFLSAAMDLVLGSLPLAEGYSTRIAVYSFEEGLETAVIEVRGAEDVPLPRGARVPAWRVRVSRGGATGTYWIDREARALVQYVAPGGSVRLVRSAQGAPGRHDTR